VAVPVFKKRNVVERFFQRLKENHRLAMRFDKRADRFFSFVLFAPFFFG